MNYNITIEGAIIKDRTTLDKVGISPSSIAERMKDLETAVEKHWKDNLDSGSKDDLDSVIINKRFKVIRNHYLCGPIRTCPWDDNLQTRLLYELTDLRTGAEVNFSEVESHMISEHGYFGELDPLEMILIFGISPSAETETKVETMLYSQTQLSLDKGISINKLITPLNLICHRSEAIPLIENHIQEVRFFDSDRRLGFLNLINRLPPPEKNRVFPKLKKHFDEILINSYKYGGSFDNEVSFFEEAARLAVLIDEQENFLTWTEEMLLTPAIIPETLVEIQRRVYMTLETSIPDSHPFKRIVRERIQRVYDRMIDDPIDLCSNEVAVRLFSNTFQFSSEVLEGIINDARPIYVKYIFENYLEELRSIHSSEQAYRDTIQFGEEHCFSQKEINEAYEQGKTAQTAHKFSNLIRNIESGRLEFEGEVECCIRENNLSSSSWDVLTDALKIGRGQYYKKAWGKLTQKSVIADFIGGVFWFDEILELLYPPKKSYQTKQEKLRNY